MDIVERLRVQWSAMGDMANAERLEASDEIERLRGIINDDRLEGAADEIERLRWENSNMEKLWGKSEGTWMEIRDKQDSEIERLREALWKIMMAYPEESFARVFARSALQQKDSE